MNTDIDTAQIAENIEKIKLSMATYAKKYCRTDSIQLLAVSKTKPAEAILAAVAAGQKSFGENYIQEAVDKIEKLKHLNLDWHFIGDLQSNKTRQVAENFNWLHTLNREKIAKRLNDQRPPHLAPLNVCIEVNIDDEASKSGINAKSVFEFADAILQYRNLCLRGLMCIPRVKEDFSEQIASFAKMQELYIALQKKYPNHNIDTLSMGMSADFEAAIAKGSTIVRLGTNIFGARNYSQSYKK